MDDFDDAMLSLALKDAFPRVLFLPKVRLLPKPGLDPAETIPECSRTLVHIWFTDKDWEPLFFPHPDYPDRYKIINPPSLHLYYRRTRWFFGSPVGERKWAFSLPMPERGHIYSGRREWDEEEKVSRKKIVKILGRLSSNRLKDWFQRDEMVATKDASRRNTWAGHHVLNWCAAERRRAIESMFRPADDWQYKPTDWYTDLSQRVIADYGQDYGVPEDPREYQKD